MSFIKCSVSAELLTLLVITSLNTEKLLSYYIHRLFFCSAPNLNVSRTLGKLRLRITQKCEPMCLARLRGREKLSKVHQEMRHKSFVMFNPFRHFLKDLPWEL